MPSSCSIQAPAKINLFLNIMGPRPDGYHDVRFVMQTLALSDTLTLHPIGDGLHLNLTCNLPNLETADNLIVKAYHAFYQAAAVSPQSFTVHLEKRIPLQAGLGGGSSNAAAMLHALNQWHASPLSPTQLSKIAAMLGSDVPFFLRGGTCLATDRGDCITPLPPLPAWEVLLLKPKAWGIPTKAAYHWLKEANAYQTQDFTAWEMFLQDPTSTLPPALLHNDFERVILPRYPQLAQAKATLQQLGFANVLLSGTGSTLFALVDNLNMDWTQLQSHFNPGDWWLNRTRILSGKAACSMPS